MKSELKKVIFNKYFICSLAFGVIIVLIHSYSAVINYYKIKQELINAARNDINPLIPTISSFTSWIGMDARSQCSRLFFVLMPFLSLVSYCPDKKLKTNRIRNIKHLKIKYYAVFISSGFTVTIPLLLDFFMISLFIPAIFPDSVYDIYYGMFSNDFMADAFYTMPYLYVFVFVVLNFIFCGLFGCVGYSLLTLLKNKFISIFTPIIIISFVEFISKKIISDNANQRNNFSPLTFLFPVKSVSTNWKIVIAEILLLFIISFYCSVLRLNKKYLYKYNDEEK
jgi:hypothetical protein